MVLRSPDQPLAGPPRAAWEVVEAAQRRRREAELVPQASHALLSGTLAARLRREAAPGVDDAVIQGIALHDIGWAPLDNEILMGQRPPVGFLDESAARLAQAWTASIENAAAGSAIAGLIVSRHFSRLAEARQAERRDTPADAAVIAGFLERECSRQQALFADEERGVDEVESLVDVLQFCDLASLYFCCGSRNAVTFPPLLGVTYRVTPQDGGYVFTPALLREPVEGTLPAHRLGGGATAARSDVRIEIR